jgi:hypothetical protein
LSGSDIRPIAAQRLDAAELVLPECQRRTGSAFGAQCRWPIERVTTTDGATLYSRTGDDGGRLTFRFCPTCGSTVWWTLETLPGFVLVALGAFADPAFPPPTASFYGTRRHPNG